MKKYMNGEKEGNTARVAAFLCGRRLRTIFLTVSSLRFVPYHSNLLEGAYIIFVTIKILKNSLNFKLKKKRQ